MRKLFVIANAACLALAATLSNAAPAQAATTTHVGVTLKEMSVVLSTSTVPAGSVTFDVTNAGSVEHEFVILRTDIAPGALPANAEQAGKAAEIGHVDEIDPVTGTKSVTVDKMRPGFYILVCNKPGHYAAGMFASLYVALPANVAVHKLSRDVSAALDLALIASGIEDLSDADAMVDIDQLLRAPGVIVTDADRAAIDIGLIPRGVDSNGNLTYSY